MFRQESMFRRMLFTQKCQFRLLKNVRTKRANVSERNELRCGFNTHTHMNAFGDTHTNAFGVWEGQLLTYDAFGA